MMKRAGCLTLFGKTSHAVSESNRAAAKMLSDHIQRAGDLYTNLHRSRHCYRCRAMASAQ
jgi:hypothetical protein